MPGTHARLSPSASKRWLSCTASPLYIERLIETKVIPKDDDTVYSTEGTEAHEWAGELLKGKIKPGGVPEFFRPYLKEYQSLCQSCETWAKPDSIRMVESKVPLFYSPDENGTVDYLYARVSDTGDIEHIFLMDLKFGAGVPVDAEGNTQLAIYAWSMIQLLSDLLEDIPPHVPVSIGIHQPRYRDDTNHKVWEISVGELERFCARIGETARTIFEAGSISELKFAPSAENCQFCQARGVCKARAEHALKDIPPFEDLDKTEAEAVDQETLVGIWSRRKAITRWLDSVEEHLTGLAHAGTPAEGTKLVQGRDSNREWKDEPAAEKTLSKYISPETMWKKTLISPAAAEKVMKADAVAKPVIETTMERLTHRAAGKAVLTTYDDKRDEIVPAVNMFSILTDEDEKE